MRTGHPMLSSKSFDFARLREYPVLMPPVGSVIRPFVDRYLLAHGMAELPYAIETVSDSFGRAFVEDTDAVWIISDGVVRRDAEAKRLAILPLDTTETRGAVGLTMRDGAPANAAAGYLMRDGAQRYSAFRDLNSWGLTPTR